MMDNGERFIRVEVPSSARGTVLSEWLAQSGHPVALPCGGRGVCGNCEVLLADGRRVPACRTEIPEEGLAVLLPPPARSPGGSDLPDPESIAAYALDIGTTTLELAAVDGDGRILFSRTCLNPQQAFGADVLSRVTAWEAGRGDELRSAVTGAADRLAEGLPRRGDLFVCGNPVMTHIFCGRSPSGLGRFPFRPEITGTLRMDGGEAGIGFADRITVLPPVSAFAGGDLSAGAVFCGTAAPGPCELYVDLGTNGEQVLRAGDRLLCTSSSAGPALEGAGLSCGTGGVPGAVCAVRRAGGELLYDTVDGAPAAGICGSGLCDLIACLLDLGVIDGGGLLREPRFTLCDGVYLTRRDVRQFQCAKSAVRACTVLLLERAGITAADVTAVTVAGGLGSWLDPASAIRTGVFPPEFAGRIRRAGNAALAGCALCASRTRGEETLAAAERFAAACEYVDPSGSGLFERLFIGGMGFGE